MSVALSLSNGILVFGCRLLDPSSKNMTIQVVPQHFERGTDGRFVDTSILASLIRRSTASRISLPFGGTSRSKKVSRSEVLWRVPGLRAFKVLGVWACRVSGLGFVSRVWD